MTKNHEKFSDNSMLQYLSLSARISLIAILVMEIQKSQGDASVLFGTRNSFSCALFRPPKLWNLEKVSYKEVIEELMSFPMVRAKTLLD